MCGPGSSLHLAHALVRVPAERVMLGLLCDLILAARMFM